MNYCSFTIPHWRSIISDLGWLETENPMFLLRKFVWKITSQPAKNHIFFVDYQRLTMVYHGIIMGLPPCAVPSPILLCLGTRKWTSRDAWYERELGCPKSRGYPNSWLVYFMETPTPTKKRMISGWWFGTCFFPYIGNNHPNWLSYFSEGWLNHQPVWVYCRILGSLDPQEHRLWVNPWT